MTFYQKIGSQMKDLHKIVDFIDYLIDVKSTLDICEETLHETTLEYLIISGYSYLVKKNF